MIPEKVYINNVLTDETTLVFKKWREDFYSLHNVRNVNEPFNNDFFEYAKYRKHILECEISGPNYEVNTILNLPIAIQEVQYMTKNEKNKALGLITYLTKF